MACCVLGMLPVGAGALRLMREEGTYCRRYNGLDRFGIFCPGRGRCGDFSRRCFGLAESGGLAMAGYVLSVSDDLILGDFIHGATSISATFGAADSCIGGLGCVGGTFTSTAPVGHGRPDTSMFRSSGAYPECGYTSIADGHR